MSFWRKLLGKRDVYPIVVDPALSFANRINRGKYRFVDRAFSDLRLGETPLVASGTLEVHLLPQQGITISKALEGLDKTKFRAATLIELLAFGERYPDVQSRFSVVGPATQVETHPEFSPGSFSVPRLATGGLGRLLDLQPLSHDMNGQQWMLASVAI